MEPVVHGSTASPTYTARVSPPFRAAGTLSVELNDARIAQSSRIFRAHIEVEFQDMPRRCFQHIARLLARHDARTFGYIEDLESLQAQG